MVESTDGEKEVFKAYIAAREESEQVPKVRVGDDVSSTLIDKVDAMLQNLKKEIDNVDAKIRDDWRLL